MTVYRVYPGPDGETHFETLDLLNHPEVASLGKVKEVQLSRPDQLRNMDFHPLNERRVLVHLSGQVEITTSDGTRQVLGPGDARLMEDVTGQGHRHRDLTPTTTLVVLLED